MVTERVYRYRTNMKFMGCAVLGFLCIGSGAFTLIPAGWDSVKNGDTVAGWVAVAAGVVSALMLLIGFAGVVMVVKDSLAGHVLRLTPTSLVLPESLRGRRDMDENGEPLGDWQPPEIPFSAILWARHERGAGKFDDRLLLVHTLGPNTLVLRQGCMRRADFDDLAEQLRSAVPAAFAQPSPRTA